MIRRVFRKTKITLTKNIPGYSGGEKDNDKRQENFLQIFLPRLDVSVSQYKDADHKSDHGAGDMSHVAGVVVRVCVAVSLVHGQAHISHNEERHREELQGPHSLPVNGVDGASVLPGPGDDQRGVLLPVEDESSEVSHSDAVHPPAAPDQPVLGVEAVGGERPGQDPREEDEADPPAAVDHLQDQAEAEEEEEVGHDVFLVSVNQAVGEIAPGLVPVVTVKAQSLGELWIVGLSEVDYYHQKGNCRNEERWRPFFDYLGICNNSEVLQQTCHRSIF